MKLKDLIKKYPKYTSLEVSYKDAECLSTIEQFMDSKVEKFLEMEVKDFKYYPPTKDRIQGTYGTKIENIGLLVIELK